MSATDLKGAMHLYALMELLTALLAVWTFDEMLKLLRARSSRKLMDSLLQAHSAAMSIEVT